MIGLSTGELLLILLVLVVLFGAKKIPQLGESLGKGLRGLRKGWVDGPPVIDVTPERPAAPGGARDASSAATEGNGTPSGSARRA